MSDTLADLSHALPTDFLAGDMEHKALFLNPYHHLPYDFSSTSSTESESDDDDIPRFTRSAFIQQRFNIPYPLELKNRVFSGSPESTFNWNGSRSSPTTPFLQPDGDSRDLIYAAAVQVARMKMKMKMNAVSDGVFANRAPLSHHHYLPNSAIRSENEQVFRQQQFLQTPAGVCGRRCTTVGPTGGPVGFRQSACPSLPVENHRPQLPVNGFASKPVLGAFSGGRNVAVVKKERAGTGVFLPRNYCNVQPEPKKKPAGLSQPLNQNMVPIIPRPQPNTPAGIAPPYHVAELVMARRHAVMLAQQRRNNAVMGPPEVVLPQEWTY